ncbi:putative transcriptional regulator [Algoriphagus sp. 4150]|uniref:hypothetical protein n=1 Tax=Algoriphagus sp. 4150 TaxID=2817756 RepID=UPI002867A8C8|nr:hypothetical protein [Algoriphagus sp. 4150]MDR7128085.1 putative transcriptional regulator [Algoriphagus sp. 4150]
MIPIFQFEVFSVREKTPLIDLLSEIKQKVFSQAPILDFVEKVIEVISTNTISRCLFDQVKNENVILPEVHISEFIPYIEIAENYLLISGKISVYEAAEIYLRNFKEMRSQLDCMIITHSGKVGEKLMGLVCIGDIAEYLID